MSNEARQRNDGDDARGERETRRSLSPALDLLVEDAQQLLRLLPALPPQLVGAQLAAEFGKQAQRASCPEKMGSVQLSPVRTSVTVDCLSPQDMRSAPMRRRTGDDASAASQPCRFPTKKKQITRHCTQGTHPARPPETHRTRHPGPSAAAACTPRSGTLRFPGRRSRRRRGPCSACSDGRGGGGKVRGRFPG